MRHILYKTDGSSEDITAKAPFNLEALQQYVGGSIQIVPLPDGSELICNEEGMLLSLPLNEQASNIWRKQYPVEKYGKNNMTYFTGIFGNVIHKEKEFHKDRILKVLIPVPTDLYIAEPEIAMQHLLDTLKEHLRRELACCPLDKIARKIRKGESIGVTFHIPTEDAKKI